MKNILSRQFLFILVILFISSCTKTVQISDFNSNWKFSIPTDSLDIEGFMKDPTTVSGNWLSVDLPHTAHIEPLVIEKKQWQGTCYYLKEFDVSSAYKNKHIALKFEGAMHTAEIYLNGKLMYTNYGGYLPFYVELNENVLYGKTNRLLVKLNNEDSPLVPPGKPVDHLDFNYYSGIYRNVAFIVKNKVHISDPVGADRVAGGGVFVRYDNVTENAASVLVTVDVQNEDESDAKVQSIVSVLNQRNETVVTDTSDIMQVNKSGNTGIQHALNIQSPELWSTEQPNLYTLSISIVSNQNVLDTFATKIGIRDFSFSADSGFVLNGKMLKLRGTNRHQDYPYIGYALSEQANYRDAYKIKDAGFNFVRLSHYPHSVSFLRACDELGILVMDAIPGWQFFGNEQFQQNSLNDVRKMIRRDRNHPCIVIWEASLNESGMTKEYMEKAHQIVHDEYPGDHVYSCGWMDAVYDLFIPARQHAKPPHYWNKYKKNKPIFIAEYGDWEYYAQNAGFNQTAYADLTGEERNSRQLRAYGQKRLVQQVLNYQEAHNSNLQGLATGDANWLMFDYNRGYAPDIESSGISDIFRLPKFAFYFYQSQAGPDMNENAVFAKPMVFIANYWNDPAFNTVKVFSNGEEVELMVNGKSIGRQLPDADKYSSHLNHPPFTFKNVVYEVGEIKAIAYINGAQVAEHVVNTPGVPVKIRISADESGKQFTAGCKDVLFIYASIVDEKGTVVPENGYKISLEVEGNGYIEGAHELETEAGISGFVLRGGKTGGEIIIKANADNLTGGELRINLY